MTRTRLSLLTLALCSAALGARAQEIQTPAPATVPGPATGGDAVTLERIDRNRDGKITKAEASADPELARRFSALDVDNSDKLDSGEFARFEAEEAPAADPLSR
jgi:hypothetical protein